MAPWGYEEFLTPHCRPQDVPAWSDPPTFLFEVRDYLLPLGLTQALACNAKAFLIVAESTGDFIDPRILPWINRLLVAVLQGDREGLETVDAKLTQLLQERTSTGPLSHFILEDSLRMAVLKLVVVLDMSSHFPAVWSPEKMRSEDAGVYEMLMDDVAQSIMHLGEVYAHFHGAEADSPEELEMLTEFYEQWWNRCMCTLAYRDVIYSEME